jgi:copper resistance protein D
MTQFLDVFGFLSVLLRGFGLAFESLTVGGVAFLSWIAISSASPASPDPESIRKQSRTLLRWAASGLIATQLCYVTIDSLILMGTSDLRWAELAGAHYVIAGLVSASAAAALLLLAQRERFWSTAALVFAAVIISCSIATSHSAARIEYRPALVALTWMHHAATGVWIGGMAYLVLALRRSKDLGLSSAISKRFSLSAQFSVAALVLAGVGLSTVYIGSVPAIYGTTYGVMVTAKVVLLGLLLLLGRMNFLLVRRLQADPAGLLHRLGRFGEAEIGIGFTVILAAASLTSMPPAVDLANSRATASEILHRFRLHMPRLKSPDVSELAPVTPLVFDSNPASGGIAPQSFVPGQSTEPMSPANIAWSEYNHNWAGIVVLTAGILAILARTNRVPFARHWPLAFIGLGVFLFLRADADVWPLGPRGFWESLMVAEVLQHRLFVLLIVGFAIFEWKVQTGRISARRAGLFFPAVCAIGGALLLTHTHGLSNAKEELLVEWSHVPLALFGVAAGWSRWLEIRSDGPERRVTSKIWPVCLALVGAILVNYRET